MVDRKLCMVQATNRPPADRWIGGGGRSQAPGTPDEWNIQHLVATVKPVSSGWSGIPDVPAAQRARGPNGSAISRAKLLFRPPTSWVWPVSTGQRASGKNVEVYVLHGTPAEPKGAASIRTSATDLRGVEGAEPSASAGLLGRSGNRPTPRSSTASSSERREALKLLGSSRDRARGTNGSREGRGVSKGVRVKAGCCVQHA